MSLPAAPSNLSRLAVSAVVLAFALTGCTATATKAETASGTPVPAPVATMEVSTGYTPTPTPSAASRAESCRIATAAVDSAQAGLNRYADSADIEAPFAAAVTSVKDAEVLRLMKAASSSLTAYLLAPQGGDAAEKAAWKRDAQAVRDRCG